MHPKIDLCFYPSGTDMWENQAWLQSQANVIHDQDCIYIPSHHAAKWNKWNCFAARLNYICEIRTTDLNENSEELNNSVER